MKSGTLALVIILVLLLATAVVLIVLLSGTDDEDTCVSRIRLSSKIGDQVINSVDLDKKSCSDEACVYTGVVEDDVTPCTYNLTATISRSVCQDEGESISVLTLVKEATSGICEDFTREYINTGDAECDKIIDLEKEPIFTQAGPNGASLTVSVI